MPPASSSSYPWDELLEEMLSGDVLARRRAWVDAQAYAGFTVVDMACADDRGRPALMTLGQLQDHLDRMDSTELIADRGRLHTPENTEFGSAEDVDGYGPALGRGDR